MGFYFVPAEPTVVEPMNCSLRHEETRPWGDKT